MTKKQLHEKLRNDYLTLLTNALTANGDEVLTTASNEIAIPCVDAEGNDEFVVFTVKVPTGGRDGEAYDGYAVKDDYLRKTAEKAQKAKEAEAKKAAKIAKDKAQREAKAKSKAEHQKVEG